MQNAPSVTYPVGRSASHTLIWLVLGALSGLTLAAACWSTWLASPSQTAWGRWLAGFALWLVWLLVAGWRWQRQPGGVLKWDAQAASLGLEAQPGAWFWLAHERGSKPEFVRPEKIFDGQSRLLLRLHGQSWPFGCWIWLERATDSAGWDDLRRALVAAR